MLVGAFTSEGRDRRASVGTSSESCSNESTENCENHLMMPVPCWYVTAALKSRGFPGINRLGGVHIYKMSVM